jgi:hypothetical protein
VWKTPELDGRNRGLSQEKGQAEKRKGKREWSHGSFLFLDLRFGRRPATISAAR